MSAAFCSCAAWAHTHSPLSLLPAFVLRSFRAGRFVLVLRWFSVAPCALRCCLLFSCHQNAAVEKRPCLGHHPSLHSCVSGSVHSLMIIFLAVMPAYATAATSTHSCPSSPVLAHVFVAAPGEFTQTKPVCLCVSIYNPDIHIHANMHLCKQRWMYTHLTEVFLIQVIPLSPSTHSASNYGSGFYFLTES